MNTNLIKILLIEDNPGDARLIKEMLAEAAMQRDSDDFEVTHVERLEQAILMLEQHLFHLILLDLSLPDSYGLETIQRILVLSPDLPVVVMSGSENQTLALEAVKAGAQDYLMKGRVDEYSLPRAIRYAIERKRSEEALRQSEEKLRLLVDLLPVGISVLDQDRNMVRFNPAIQRLLALSEEGLRQKQYTQYGYLDTEGEELPPERFPGVRALKEQVSIDDVEVGIVKEDGEIQWTSISAVPVNLPGWKVVITAADITRRKRMEEEMQRRNRELRLLNQIIAASAADLEPADILEIACRELAMTLDLPHATAMLLDEDDAVATIVAEYRATPGPPSIGLRLPVTQEPSLQYLRQMKAPLAVDQAQQDPRLASIHPLLKQRQVVSILVLPLIIEGEVAGSLNLETSEPYSFSSEQINLAWRVAGHVAGALARARLVLTHQRLVTAIEQVTENIVITDTQGKIIYVNPGFERLTGYSRAEVIGRNSRLLKSGEQKPEFYREMWATISAGQIWRGRLTNRKKDGSLYVEDMTITPVRDQEGAITNYVAVKRDITRETQLEAQYHQAQKLEALGRLTGGIAHDFNNLLTAIIGFAELAYSEYPADDPKQELMDKVLSSSRRAADLVRQLLVFSRKQVVEPRLLNLNDIVSESNKMLERIIGEDIELRTKLASGLWAVKMDPSQVVQVIMNLAVNARDAMPEGGQLTIETANVILDEAYPATHMDVQSGEYVLLAFSDTWMGMSKAVQTHIFEPFFTTKEAGKGTGLGLATVYGIVEQCKGSIWVYSEEGQGTTFKIYLPRATALTPLPAEAPAREIMALGHETILLVEDNESVRSLFSHILETQGYTVLAAADGRAALNLVEGQTRPIDLLLSDIVMPHVNGKILAEQLAQIYPHLKIIFISGYTDHTAGELPSEANFLQKPLSPMTLVRKVRQVLDKS